LRSSIERVKRSLIAPLYFKKACNKKKIKEGRMGRGTTGMDGWVLPDNIT